MKVVYFSVTGQTKRFAAKLNVYETTEIDPTVELEMKEPYVLVVPTYEAEFIAPVFDFLETGENQKFLAGVGPVRRFLRPRLAAPARQAVGAARS